MSENNTDLLKKFDEIVSSDRIYLNLSGNGTVDELADEENLNLMKYIKKIENRESKS